MKELRQFKKIKEFKETFFEVFGMTVEEAKGLLQQRKPIEYVETTKKPTTKETEQYSPGDDLKQFTEGLEELYPHGKRS